MHLVSAAALEIFTDAPARRSPNATLIGQALSSGGLPACPWRAPTSPAVAAQRKAGLREAAGTTAPPEAQQCQEPGTIRRPRAPATSAPLRLFDSPRRNAYTQSTGTQSTGTQSTGTQSTGTHSTDAHSTDTHSPATWAADEVASTPARSAVGLRVTPSAIRDEPTVGNKAVGLPRARAPSARVGHSNTARRNPYAQRPRPLAPDDAASATARCAAGPRETSATIRDEPTVGKQTIDRRRAPATAARIGNFDPARRNAYAQRMHPLAPDDAVLAPPRHAAGPHARPSAIRHEPTIGDQTIELPRTRPTRAQLDHFDPARRNAYAQRTGSPTPDDAAPARRPAGLRLAPAAARPGPAIAGRAGGLPHKPVTCAHGGLNGFARRGRSSAIASSMCR
jgi:hypothetical protein